LLVASKNTDVSVGEIGCGSASTQGTDRSRGAPVLHSSTLVLRVFVGQPYELLSSGLTTCDGASILVEESGGVVLESLLVGTKVPQKRSTRHRRRVSRSGQPDGRKRFLFRQDPTWPSSYWILSAFVLCMISICKRGLLQSYSSRAITSPTGSSFGRIFE
jgi:hypothetical protein